jgi:hypothetical protein
MYEGPYPFLAESLPKKWVRPPCCNSIGMIEQPSQPDFPRPPDPIDKPPPDIKPVPPPDIPAPAPEVPPPSTPPRGYEPPVI